MQCRFSAGADAQRGQLERLQSVWSGNQKHRFARPFPTRCGPFTQRRCPSLALVALDRAQGHSGKQVLHCRRPAPKRPRRLNAPPARLRHGVRRTGLFSHGLRRRSTRHTACPDTGALHDWVRQRLTPTWLGRGPLFEHRVTRIRVMTDLGPAGSGELTLV
jgi:hypothetical protein